MTSSWGGVAASVKANPSKLHRQTKLDIQVPAKCNHGRVMVQLLPWRHTYALLSIISVAMGARVML